MPVGEVPFERIATLLRKGIEHVEETADALGDDPKGVEPLHDHRKAARRLEARLDLAHFALKPTTLGHARALVVGLARGLGKHRDADVAIQRLHELGHDAELGPIDAPRPGGRRKDVERAVRAAKPARLRRPLEKQLRAANLDASGDPVLLLAARTRLRLERAVATADFPDLHALRIEVKSLRYGLEALADEAASEGEALADLLGEATDARMLRDRVVADRRAPAAEALLLTRSKEATRRAHAALRRAFAQRELPRLAEILDATSIPSLHVPR